MRKFPVPISILVPLLMVGACQPAGDPAAELEAALTNLPPGHDDPPPLDGPITPAPRNLRVTKNFGGAVIQLDFDCGGNAELHEIFHQVDGGVWNKIDEGCVEDGPLRGHIFDNHGIQPLHNYCYKVKASNVDHDATSEVRCVTADRWRAAPVLPQLSIGEIRRDYITVLIVDRSVTESGFHLLRRTKGVDAPFVSVVDFDARLGINLPIVHRDERLPLGNTYEYKVNVFDRFGNNADTPIVEAVAFPSVPQSPSQILFDARATRSLAVHWTNGADVVDKYHLTVAGPGDSLSFEVGGGTLDQTLSSLAPGSQYCVTITAENESGVSGPARQCANTLAQPPSGWPANTFDLKVDAPIVTRISDGDAHSTAWYRFSFKVCNDLPNRPAVPAPGYRVFADLDGLELTLDHPAHALGANECDTFLATDGVWAGLHSVKVEVQPTSGNEGYGSNNVNNKVFTVR